MGYDFKLSVRTDSSAAIGICSRYGSGSIKHMDIKRLWVQEKITEDGVVVTKVPGEENPADLMTKHLDRARVDALMSRLSLVRKQGRHALAPLA